MRRTCTMMATFMSLFFEIGCDISLPKDSSNLRMQQSPVILGLCLRKTRSGKSQDYPLDLL